MIIYIRNLIDKRYFQQMLLQMIGIVATLKVGSKYDASASVVSQASGCDAGVDSSST